MNVDRFRKVIAITVLFIIITVVVLAMGKVSLFWPLYYIPLIVAAYTYDELGGLAVSIPASLIILISVYMFPVENSVSFYEQTIEFSAAAAIMIGVGLFIGWLSKKQKRKLKYFHDTSMIDRLTGLHNYGYFWERLEEERKRADRFGSRLALIMVDIDNFKVFNDRFGHVSGNLMLKKLARVIEQSVRDVDIVCRYGSEEFVVILPNTDREAERVAERIRIATEEACFEGDKDEPVVKKTVSAGVSIYPANCENEIELIDKADHALQFAKEHGRNRVSTYESSMEPARK